MDGAAVSRASAAAAAVAVAGGVALGLAPLPLSPYGCSAAFYLAPYSDLEGDVSLACAEQRAERQDLVAGMVVLGLATATGAQVAVRRPRQEAPVDAR